MHQFLVLNFNFIAKNPFLSNMEVKNYGSLLNLLFQKQQHADIIIDIFYTFFCAQILDKAKREIDNTQQGTCLSYELCVVR